MSDRREHRLYISTVVKKVDYSYKPIVSLL